MIKVEKLRSQCPEVLVKKGAIELTMNLRWVRKDAKKLSYTVYKEKEVVKALYDIFNKKCAYCESKVKHAAPSDIEHFRPKSKTLKKGAKRNGYVGYYWLAAEWDNLLLSCQYCNRPNQHYVPGLPDMITIGKHEQFPLSDEKYRCSRHGDAATFRKDNRARLLLHPCKDEVRKYFVFVTEGKDSGIIKAAAALAGKELKKAEKSIEVYALHRMDLVTTRAEYLDELKKKKLSILQQIDIGNKIKGKALKAEINTNINNALDDLITYALPDKIFSAMAKQFIGEFLAQIKVKVPGWK